jgi:hypothetical protein
VKERLVLGKQQRRAEDVKIEKIQLKMMTVILLLISEEEKVKGTLVLLQLVWSLPAL